MEDCSLVYREDTGYILAFMSGHFGNSGILVCRSVDGEHWSKPIELTESGSQNRSPSLVLHPSGHIYLLWSHVRIYRQEFGESENKRSPISNSRLVYTSSEDGSNWAKLKILPLTVRSMNNEDPYLFNGGTYIWLTWICSSGQGKVFISRTLDFERWAEPAEITSTPGYFQWPCLTVDPNGEFYAFFESRNQIMHTRSFDGRHWEPPIVLSALNKRYSHPRIGKIKDRCVLLFHEPVRLDYASFPCHASSQRIIESLRRSTEIHPVYRESHIKGSGIGNFDLLETGGTIVQDSEDKLAIAFASKRRGNWGIYFMTGEIRR
jgi:hypothetical protein